MSEEKKNIYQRLADLKVELQQKEIPKSGKNEALGYKYHELRDFLPVITELNQQHGLLSVFDNDTENEVAVLRIYNTDKPDEYIDVRVQYVSAEMQPKTDPIQKLGATQTYLRRYAYMNAYDIIEHDIVDASAGSEPKKPKVNTDEAIKKLKAWVKERVGDKAPEVEKSAMTNLGIEKWSDVEWGDNSSKKAVFDELKDEIDKVKKAETNKEAEGMLDD